MKTDIASTMEETVSDLNQRIAERVRELRAARGLSLDALASKSGVSPWTARTSWS